MLAKLMKDLPGDALFVVFGLMAGNVINVLF